MFNMYRSLFILTVLISHCVFVYANEKVTLKVSKIEEGVYLHQSFKNASGFGLVDSNGLVVIDQDQAFMIDTPWSEVDTKALVEWIKAKGFKLAGSFSTHSHDDRTAGISWLNHKGIATYTSKRTDQILAGNKRSRATHVIDADEFFLFNGRLNVYFAGPAHTPDNTVVWLPQSKLLFGGCMIRGLDWNSLGYIGDANIGQWANSVIKVRDRYDSEKVIPGHGKIAGAELLNHTIELAKKADKK